MTDLELKEYAQLSTIANQADKIIYLHENGGYELIDQLTYHTCIYSNGEWVTNEEKLIEYQETIYSRNKVTAEKLIAEATLEIGILQDKIDLNESEAGDSDLLLAWKRYRIALKNLDLNDINIKFLDKPTK